MCAAFFFAICHFLSPSPFAFMNDVERGPQSQMWGKRTFKQMNFALWTSRAGQPLHAPLHPITFLSLCWLTVCLCPHRRRHATLRRTHCQCHRVHWPGRAARLRRGEPQGIQGCLGARGHADDTLHTPQCHLAEQSHQLDLQWSPIGELYEQFKQIQIRNDIWYVYFNSSSGICTSRRWRKQIVAGTCVRLIR